jgi:nitroreductase
VTKDKVRSTEEALRLALEAIKLANSSHNMVLTSDPPQSAWRYHNVDMKLREAISAIKAALEAKDEPVACADNGVVNWIADKQFMHEAELYITQPQQELVCVCGAVWEGQELVEVPPQRTWVGLTEDEILSISADCASTHQHTDIHFARAIEVKLKEKNYA